MRLWFGVLFAFGMAAEGPAPLGIVQGKLVELKEAQPYGELVIESAEKSLFRFQFNLRTYVERGRSRISIASIHVGETVEILSDVGQSSDTRYARIVHVSDPNAPPRPTPRPWRTKPYVSPTENIVPRGDLAFSGVIREISGGALVLRTRLDGDKQIRLRPDTRYLEGGSTVDAAALQANTRVYVRAGRNLEGDIEAYQVIWGAILEPKQ